MVLITFESLRADHVGCYGYKRDTTPSIDALAAQGIVYQQAHSVTSWTLTAHASMFTGLYPTAHQVIGPKDALDDSYTTLAEALAGAGYQTAGVISGPFLRASYNLNQGFGYYDQSSANPKGSNAAWSDVTNPALEAGIQRFLEDLRDPARPFFLFIYLWDPHYDYLPPDPYNKRFIPPGSRPIDLKQYETGGVVTKNIEPRQLAYVISQYDGEILCTDALLGRVWKQLRDLGLWEETAIVFTADHGEEFFEHGTKGHKNNLYVESVHVPLVIKPPGRVEPRREPGLVSLIDLYPTVLDWAGVTPAAPIHGRSLLRPPPARPQARFFELVTSNYFIRGTSGEKYVKSKQWYAVRDGDYKLVNLANTDVWELYNLALDPREQHPLEGGAPGVMAQLQEKLATHREAMEAAAAQQAEPQPADLTTEDIDQLKALGYMKAGEKSGDQGP